MKLGSIRVRSLKNRKFLHTDWQWPLLQWKLVHEINVELKIWLSHVKIQISTFWIKMFSIKKRNYLYWGTDAICTSLPTLVCILLHCSQWLPASTCTCTIKTLTTREQLDNRMMPRMTQKRSANLVNSQLPQQHAVSHQQRPVTKNVVC